MADTARKMTADEYLGRMIDLTTEPGGIKNWESFVKENPPGRQLFTSDPSRVADGIAVKYAKASIYLTVLAMGGGPGQAMKKAVEMEVKIRRALGYTLP